MPDNLTFKYLEYLFALTYSFNIGKEFEGKKLLICCFIVLLPTAIKDGVRKIRSKYDSHQGFPVFKFICWLKMDLQHFRYPFTRNVFKILKIIFEKIEIVHNQKRSLK